MMNNKKTQKPKPRGRPQVFHESLGEGSVDAVCTRHECIDEHIHRYTSVGNNFQVHLQEISLPSAWGVVCILERFGALDFVVDVLGYGFAVGQAVLGIIWVVCGVLMIIVSQTSYQKDYDKINKAY